MGFVVFVLLVLLLVVGVALGVLVGHTVLGPVNRAARTSRHAFRFELTDFVWLLVQMQVVLAAIVGFVPRDMQYYFVPMLVGGAFAVTAMWLGAVWTMAKAGVTAGRRRAAFILVLLPFTTALIGAVITVIVFTPIQLLMVVGEVNFNQSIEPRHWVPLIVMAALTVVIVAAWFGLRWLAVWVLAGARPAAELEADPSS